MLPPRGVGAPSSGKSWKRHWLKLTLFYIVYLDLIQNYFSLYSMNFIFNTYQWRIQDFPKGRQLPRGCANLLFCKCFAESCMKMKEFGLREWGVKDPPLHIFYSFYGLRFRKKELNASGCF